MQSLLASHREPRVTLPVEVRWHGRGGQGVVTASRLLATAALDAGLYPQSLPDFGAERSGAPVASYTRIGEEPPRIRGPVTAPDAVIVLDPTLIGAVDVLEGVTPGASLIVNTSRAPDEVLDHLGSEGIVCCTADGDAISMRLLGRRLPNSPLLGAALRAFPVLDIEDIEKVLVREMTGKFPDAVVQGNASALKEGWNTAQVAGPR